MAKVCMIVPDKNVQGGIASVVNGYTHSPLEKKNKINYVISYCDGSKWKKLFQAVKGYVSFAGSLLFFRPEIIHIHSSFGPSFYRKMPFILAGSLMHIPIVNHIHGAEFEDFYFNASEKKKKLIRTIYNKCDCLIALSEEWKQKLSQIVPEEKIHVIPNYSKIAKNLEEHPCNYKILFLGEIGKRKGCYDIPLIAEKVKEVYPQMKFILCGDGDRTDVENVRAMIDEKGLTEMFEFPGWVRGEKKDFYLREADLFLLPSYNEGMPMSILDAMGYGLPIVSTNVGGIPQIVLKGKNGFVCPPGNFEEMAKCIIQIFDENLFATYGKGSLSIIKQKYSLKKHIQDICDVYEKVLKSQGGNL